MPMRRKDREMDRNFGLEVLDRAVYAVLSVCEAGSGLPYSLPLSIVRIGCSVYFHSAREGRKVQLLRAGIPARLVAVGRVEVPELYTASEREAMAGQPERAHELARRVFTTQYESAIACGKIRLVMSQEEREAVLAALCRKYCPGKEDLIGAAIAGGGPRAAVYALDMEDLTAKRKWYDPEGREMRGNLHFGNAQAGEPVPDGGAGRKAHSVMEKKEKGRITPEFVESLDPGQIFVFGSNLQGAHGGGAARLAYNRFGARWGVGAGMTGSCYAIPTMQGGVETIRPYVQDFVAFAARNPQWKFLVTRIGCGIAGFTDAEIAPLFSEAAGLENVALPLSFWRILAR